MPVSGVGTTLAVIVAYVLAGGLAKAPDHAAEALRAQLIPSAINRGAYYMTNWIGLADAVRQSGKLPSMFPAVTIMPMVAPQGRGEAAAARLLSHADDTVVRYVEGPAR